MDSENWKPISRRKHSVIYGRMSKTKTIDNASPTRAQTDEKKVIEDLHSAVATLQDLIDHQGRVEQAPAESSSSQLRQIYETVRSAEVQLQQQEKTLQESQQKAERANELLTLIDALPVGIVVAHDPENHNMTINSAGSKMLNLPPGTSGSLMAPGRSEQPFKAFRAGQEIPVEELPMYYALKHKGVLHDIELDIRHPDGKVISVLVYAQPLRDELGRVRGSLSVLVDITARKSIDKRLLMQYTIARVLAESFSINKAAAQVLQLICETIGWEYGALWRVEQDPITLTNEGVWHAEDTRLAVYAESVRYSVYSGDDDTLPGHVLHSGKPLWFSSLEDFHSADAIEAEKVGLRSAFILPMRNRDRIIAILECLSDRHQTEDRNLIAMLSAVGNQISIFLERKQLEEALANRVNQLRILAQSGLALTTTLDYKERLETVAHVIVPDLADWCAIDMIGKDRILQRVAAAHVDPSKEKLIFEIQPPRLIDFTHVNTPQLEALVSGQSLLYTDLPESFIEKTVIDPHQLEIIHQLDPISAIVVPLITPDQNMGICTFVQSDSGRHYLSSDLALAEDIGRRIALAMDNAILYEQSQNLNTELERRVEDRTSQLKLAVRQLTTQIEERQSAEEQVRRLNAELEQRIEERTSQLEIANRDLQKEVIDRQRASQTLRILLKRSRELYRISQTIGTVRTPNESVALLLSSSYLKDVSRASIAILDTPWLENTPLPEYCFILAEWNKGKRQPRFIDQRFTLEEYGVLPNISYGKPIVIQDIQSVNELPESVKERFARLHTHGLIILPLIAGGECYGLLSLHFTTNKMANMDDLRHVSGLVDEMAIAINSIRSLEAESQARQEAERANELKLKFLGMISHELRTPLTSIKGFATTLLADDVVWSADKQREFLETINSESDKLHELIEQLLDLSRIEAGVLRISPVKVSMNKIIDSALAQLRAITINHDLVLDLPTKLPPIMADEQRIAQVLTNLVSNAVKFSPAQSQITITARQANDMVQVDVADQGPGIPPSDAERVFEAFRQLESGSVSRTKGAGLGLAICKGLIEAHHGKIWVQDHHGPGTIISFTIPVWRRGKRIRVHER